MSAGLTNVWVLLGAVAVDAAWGEVPARVHPVVGIGTLTRYMLRWQPSSGARAQFVFGLVLVGVVVGCSVALGWAVAWAVGAGLRGVLAIAAEALALSTLFAARGLLLAGKRMTAALSTSLFSGRAALSHLCSRDPSALTEAELVGATVESLSENTSDSFVAPLFWYACFAGLGLPGLAGAAMYRAANTLDAMVGYRGAYEYVGKAAARFDDLLNWVPARLTAGVMVVSALFVPQVSARRARRLAFRDHALTASPNAGWPMSSAAGALGVQLSKRGEYTLGAELKQPTARDIQACQRLVVTSCAVWVMLLSGALAASAWRGSAGL